MEREEVVKMDGVIRLCEERGIVKTGSRATSERATGIGEGEG